MSAPSMSRMQFVQAAQQSLNFKGVCTIPHGVNLDTGSIIWRANFRGRTGRDLYVPEPFLSLPGLPSTSERYRTFFFSERPGRNHLVWEYRRLQMTIDHLSKKEEEGDEKPEAAVKYTPTKQPSTTMEYLQQNGWVGGHPVDETYEVDEDSPIVEGMRHFLSDSSSKLIDTAKLFYEERWDCLEMLDDLEMGIKAEADHIHRLEKEGSHIPSLVKRMFSDLLYSRDREKLAHVLCDEIVRYLESMAGSPHSLPNDEGRLVIPAALAPSVARHYRDTGWPSLLAEISLIGNENMNPVVRGIMIFHGLAQAIDLKHWNHASEMLLMSAAHHEEINDRASVREDSFRSLWVAQQGIRDEANGQLFDPVFGINDADFQMAREILEELTVSQV